MSDLKILYLIGQLTRGGAEQQLYNLLANLKLEATVVSLSRGGYWGEPIRRLGYQVIELERWGHAEIRRLWQVAHLIRTLRPDLVHIFLDGVSGLYGRLGALLGSHSQVIVNERRYPAFHPAWYRIMLPWLNRAVVAIVCNSEVARDYLVTRGLAPQEKVLVIPNGIDLDRFRAFRFSERRPWPTSWRGKPVVGTVSHLTYAKSPETFIQAASQIHDCRPEVRFAVVGDGPLRPWVQRLAASRGLDEAIWLMGERQDVPALLQAMDVFVSASRSEGLPNAIIEAMASGLPCVVTDAGGCRELVVGGETGYVVPVGAADQLADKVLNLLASHEVRRTMGLRARARVEREFSINTAANRYWELYARLVRSPV